MWRHLGLASTLGAAIVLGVTSGAAAQAAPSATTIISRADLPFQRVFDDAAVPVQSVRLTGVVAYDPRALLRFAIAHEQRSRGQSSLAGTVSAIEVIYREDGYLLTEATTSLDPASGLLTVDVREGYVTRLSIEGLRDRVASRVTGYLRPLLNRRPLRNADFERALMLASDLSGVYLTSEFSFDADSEGATLRVVGVEARSGGSLSVDLVPVRPDVAGRVYASQEVRGVAIGGDMLRVVGVDAFDPSTAHSLGGTLSYRTPFGTGGAYLEGFAGNAYIRPSYVDDNSRFDRVGLDAAAAVGYPLRRDLNNYVYAIGEYEYEDSTSRLGGSRIDSSAHVARAYLVQGHTAPAGGVAQVSLSVTAGVRPDANTRPDDGDRRFMHVRAGMGVVSGLPFISDRTYLRMEASGQWTADRLPGIERFGFGFQPHGRGYAPFEVEGDKGVASAIELSYLRPVSSGGLRELMPFLFVDGGMVASASTGLGATARTGLLSTGPGIRLAFNHGRSLEAWMGVPLLDGPRSRSGHPAGYLRLTQGWGR
jgi:hemolysin activation/secretion protein